MAQKIIIFFLFNILCIVSGIDPRKIDYHNLTYGYDTDFGELHGKIVVGPVILEPKNDEINNKASEIAKELVRIIISEKSGFQVEPLQVEIPTFETGSWISSTFNPANLIIRGASNIDFLQVSVRDENNIVGFQIDIPKIKTKTDLSGTVTILIIPSQFSSLLSVTFTNLQLKGKAKVTVYSDPDNNDYYLFVDSVDVGFKIEDIVVNLGRLEVKRVPLFIVEQFLPKAVKAIVNNLDNIFKSVGDAIVNAINNNLASTSMGKIFNLLN